MAAARINRYTYPGTFHFPLRRCGILFSTRSNQPLTPMCKRLDTLPTEVLLNIFSNLCLCHGEDCGTPTEVDDVNPIFAWKYPLTPREFRFDCHDLASLASACRTSKKLCGPATTHLYHGLHLVREERNENSTLALLNTVLSRYAVPPSQLCVAPWVRKRPN